MIRCQKCGQVESSDYAHHPVFANSHPFVAEQPVVKKRKGRWGTTHYYIEGVKDLEGDYQKTGNAFDTVEEACAFSRDLGYRKVIVHTGKHALAYES